MRCLEASEIERYVSGVMDRRVAEEVTAHLETCARCRRAVAEARQRVSPPQPDPAMLRVQCPGCSARYGIPEERVRGRLLKVRCKSCGTVLEVRGDTGAPRSVLDRARKQWFLIIRKDRVGPITADEVRERFRRGELHPRTHAWRQGMPRWERLQDITEFQTMQPVPLDTAPPAERHVASAPVNLNNRDELHFDSSAADTLERKPAAAPATSLPAPVVESIELSAGLPEGWSYDEEQGEGPTLVQEGKRVLKPGESGERVRPGPSQELKIPDFQLDDDDPLAGPDPFLPDGVSAESIGIAAQRITVGEGQRMSGQRHDDSVLFSLVHMREFAHKPTVKPGESHPSGLTGLFEIRPVAPRPAPLLLPVENDENLGQSSTGVIIAVGLGGVIVGAATLFGILNLVRPELVRDIFRNEPSPPADIIAGGTGRQVGNSEASRLPRTSPLPAFSPDRGVGKVLLTAAVPKSASATGESPEPREKPEPAATKTGQPAPGAAATRSTEARPTTKPPASRSSARAVAKKLHKPAHREALGPADDASIEEQAKPKQGGDASEQAGEESKQEAPSKSASPKDADQEAEDKKAAEKQADEAKPAPAPNADGQAGKQALGLSREQIAAGMKRALPAVQVCNEKFSETGQITVEATIESTGRISKATLVGSLAQAPIGVCVLEAVKQAARFPTFKGKPVTIQYPFVLRSN